MAVVPSSSHGGVPSGAAGGDLSGTYPNPTVAKVNGVSISGTPQSGYVPTATGASAATWQAAGGSTPGAAIVRGPFSFAFNTASINNGVAFYTPTVNDILLEAWIELTTSFDGTTPLADIGPFLSGETQGLFGSNNAPVKLNGFADSQNITGLLNHVGNQVKPGTAGNEPATGDNLKYTSGTPTGMQRNLPGKFVSASPWLVVVSQDGTKGGTAVGGTAGAGLVYLKTATPVAFS